MKVFPCVARKHCNIVIGWNHRYVIADTEHLDSHFLVLFYSIRLFVYLFMYL